MTKTFERFAGYCAIASGLGGFLYAVAFVLIARAAPDFGQNLSWLLLMVGGLLTVPVMVALYHRLREPDPAIAMWALLLAVTGAVGATLHGGYGFANALHPPPGGGLALPSEIDPRGLLTFGFAGAGLLIFAQLMRRTRGFPAGLSSLAFAAAALLIVIYLARLIILTATNPLVLVPAAISGFLVGPAFYVWLGVVFLRKE